MSNKERYADIFDMHGDVQRDQQLEWCLDELETSYQGNPPPVQLNWTRFQMQLPQPAAQATRSRKLWSGNSTFSLARGRRFSLPLPVGIALCMLVMIISASAVYASGAFPKILLDMFESNPGTNTLLQDKQLTTINKTFEADGYKLTLQEGYADANQAILAFSLTLPHPPSLSDLSNSSGYWYVSNDYSKFQLMTPEGVNLPLINASSAVAKKGDIEALLYNFDTANMAYKQNQLPLQLTIPVKCNNRYQCSRTATFDFTLPFHIGDTILPHQAINLNGKTLTLEKVVTAPSETRFYIGGFSLDDDTPTLAQFNKPVKTFTSKHFNVTLSNGKKTYSICTVMYDMCGAHDIPAFEKKDFENEMKDSFQIKLNTGTVADIGSGDFDARLYLGNDKSVIGLTLPQSVLNEHGNWKVTVTQTVTQLHWFKDPKTGNPSYAPAGSYVVDPTAKPWVFTLNLP